MALTNNCELKNVLKRLPFGKQHNEHHINNYKTFFQKAPRSFMHSQNNMRIVGAIFCANLFLLTSLSNAELFKIQGSAIFTPHRLGKIELSHDENKFYVLQNGKHNAVKPYWVDKSLQNIPTEKLKAFLKKGYISINQMNDGEFSLKANVRGLGGGPVCGAIAYWATKTFCYGTAVAAASTIVVTTGGAAGAATSLFATTITGSATSGATAVGSLIAGYGLGSEAAVATVGVVSTSGGLAGAVAAVETASLATGTFFTMIPFLP